MVYAAWDAKMSTPDEKGVTPRASREQLTRGGGRPDLLPQLQGPPFPEPLEYLWYDRFLVLHGMRGQSMSGLAPFTPEMIDAADRLFGWRITPSEVHALRQLDIVTRDPDALKVDDDG